MRSSIRKHRLRKVVLLLFPAFLIVSGNFIANSNAELQNTCFEQANPKKNIAISPADICAVAESNEDDTVLDSGFSFIDSPGTVGKLRALQFFIFNPDKIPSPDSVSYSLSARAPPAL